MAQSKSRSQPPSKTVSEPAAEPDVDRTSEDSFPASDPPSWAMGSEKRAHNVEVIPAGAPTTAAKAKSAVSSSSSRDTAAHEGKTIAILATDGFEQSELMEPKRALEQVGIRTQVISLKSGRIRGWKKMDWGEEVDVDVTLDTANPEDYDGLVLPGGVMNPDKLRMDQRAVNFVKAFVQQHKPVAAICHGPWLLVEAGVIKGRQLTSWPSLKTDIRNAGGQWLDKEVVEDEHFITSRKPDDLPAFNRKLLEAIAQSHAEAV